MKAKFIQNGLHGCGLFSIANVLNLPDFITPERIEASKTGNNIYQLSTWLNEDGYKYFLAPLYFDYDEDIKIPDHVSILRNIDDQHTPLVITGQYKKGQLNHMVAGLLDGESNVTIIDSFTGRVTKIQLSEIHSLFEVLNGIYGLADIESGEYIGFIQDAGKEYLESLNA